MRLFIIRHGQTDANAADLLQGHSQNPLNELGHQQAAMTAARLKDEKIDHLYASDLKRARETARPISAACGLSINLTSKLRERAYGVFENRSPVELNKEREAQGFQKHDYRPQGGESYFDVKARAADFLTLLFNRYHGDETIALVAHGGMNRMLLCCLLDLNIIEAVEMKQNNCCVNIISLDHERQVKESVINCTAHLDL